MTKTAEQILAELDAAVRAVQDAVLETSVEGRHKQAKSARTRYARRVAKERE